MFIIKAMKGMGISGTFRLAKQFSSTSSNSMNKKLSGYALSAAVGVIGGAIGMSIYNGNKRQDVDFKGNFPKKIAHCAPEVRLFDALKLRHPSPPDAIGKQRHDFKWSHTAEAVNINPGSAVYEAEKRNFEEWNEAAAKLFGQEYGKIKVHHVLLIDNAELEKEIKRGMPPLLSVSQSHKNWKWLTDKTPMATFIYDDQVEAYRVYVYTHYVLLELGSDKGYDTVPLSIKFTSDFKEPTTNLQNEVYVKEIIENFDLDYEYWRQKCTYIY